MKSAGSIIVTLLTALASGCTDISPTRAVRLPTQPSAVQTPLPPPAELTGLVTDSALRPIAGARVEIADGLRAGASTTTDSVGTFRLDGTFDTGTRVRASMGGYVAADSAVACPLCTLVFRLRPERPSIDMTGQYTLTLAADPTCHDLPGPLVSRNFTATVSRSSPPDWPPDTSFAVTVAGETVLDEFRRFSIHTAADNVTFFLEETDRPALIEQIAATEFLAFNGIARASAEPPGVPISAPFEGYIHQCTLPSLPFSWHGCDEAPGHQGCHSKNNRLTFTRR